MVGTCVRDYRTLKGGVCCYGANKQTCYCSKVGCGCTNKTMGGSGCFDARYNWCDKFDKDGKYNSWCKERPLSPGPLVEGVVLPATLPEYKGEICAKQCGFLDPFCEGAKTQAGCGGSSNDYATLALIGIGVLAVFMMVS